MINYNIGDLITRLTQVNSSQKKSQFHLTEKELENTFFYPQREDKKIILPPVRLSYSHEVFSKGVTGGCILLTSKEVQVKKVLVPRNKENEQILRELHELGVIGPYSISKGGILVNSANQAFEVPVKDDIARGSPCAPLLGRAKLEIISKPGKRVYTNYKEVVAKLGNGYNTYILRTSEGIVSSQTAIRRRIGGELLIKITPTRT
jgi:ribosomal protein S8